MAEHLIAERILRGIGGFAAAARVIAPRTG